MVNTGNHLLPKIFNNIKTTLGEKMLKNAIAYVEICGICANICKFLDMQHMRHNFRICDFENSIICRKI